MGTGPQDYFLPCQAAPNGPLRVSPSSPLGVQVLGNMVVYSVIKARRGHHVLSQGAPMLWGLESSRSQ